MDDDLNLSTNPQPPPLTAEEKEILESDKIGDTAYSKKWVLSVLLHMMEGMNKTDQQEEKDGDSKEESSDENIDPDLEEELCELWDMTMDSDVSKYLHGEDAIDLILEVILMTKSLRKLEICLGILANMACTQDVCKIMVEHATLSDVTLFHIDNPDVRTLIELARLIGVCLANRDSRQRWIQALKDHSIIDKFIFILENSLNVELLDGVTDVVDKLIDYDDSILETFSTTKTVNMICDVYRRTAVKHPQTVQSLLHILQLISTTEKGVSALASVQDSGDIARIILIEGSKYFTPLDSNFPSLVSSCCILNVLLSAETEEPKTFNKKDFKMLSTVLSLTEELSERVSINEDEQQETCTVYKQYFAAVKDFLVVLIEMFLEAEVTDKIIGKLKERKTQISSVILILKTVPDYKTTVCKLLESLRRHGILDDNEDKDRFKRDNRSNSSNSNFANNKDSVSPR